jgi:hypothetical protein
MQGQDGKSSGLEHIESNPNWTGPQNLKLGPVPLASLLPMHASHEPTCRETFSVLTLVPGPRTCALDSA